MAISETLASATPESLPGLLFFAATGFLCLVIHRVFFDGLRGVPGPLICRLTSLWTYYHSYIGDECTRIDELHKKYGPFVRIAPNEVSISDGAALATIYIEKGGFLKAPCYANFDFDGHSTIFSTRDPAHRAVRSKAVVPLFSMTSIRSGQETIEVCVDRLIDRMKREAEESRMAVKQSAQCKPINVLNLARSLAVDAVSSYLFGTAFGGVNEQTDKMSATTYVDTLVAIGRFFFLPNWIFLALEMSRARLWPDRQAGESTYAVDNFVEPLVHDTDEQQSTYQGRLLKAGITKHEIEVQCKDVVFAGTDSTGTNFATICWNLAKRPEVYKQLQEEVAKADAEDPTYNPQTLPWLDAVVREGLRVSMANPTRFPRVVPPQGFNFEACDGRSYYLPGGTQVGIQPFTLHFNPDIFPDPNAYKPERWLEDPTPEMQRDWIPFGMGSRQCIARNLATTESFLATRALARSGVLEGAEAVGDKIEFVEWFNSKIKGERIELVWR